MIIFGRIISLAAKEEYCQISPSRKIRGIRGKEAPQSVNIARIPRRRSIVSIAMGGRGSPNPRQGHRQGPRGRASHFPTQVSSGSSSKPPCGSAAATRGRFSSSAIPMESTQQPSAQGWKSAEGLSIGRSSDQVPRSQFILSFCKKSRVSNFFRLFLMVLKVEALRTSKTFLLVIFSGCFNC